MTTQFTKLFSFILASVNDPPPEFQPAYRLQCHSCMSAYLEDQFMYISHLYQRPIEFTEKCNRGNFDWRYVRTKNCTDPCVTLRINDKVGGRRRHGYIRGCLSDIIHYNHSVISVYGRNTAGSSKIYEKGVRINSGNSRIRTAQYSYCNYVRLRDLFLTSDRYNFDAFDHVELCTCTRPLCNKSTYIKLPNQTLWVFYTISIVLSLLFI